MNEPPVITLRRLANGYQVSQAIHVMAREALPLTSTGKVQKFRLAEALARGQVLHSDILPREA